MTTVCLFCSKRRKFNTFLAYLGVRCIGDGVIIFLLPK